MKLSFEEALNKTQQEIAIKHSEELKKSIENHSATNFMKSKIEQFLKQEEFEVENNDKKIMDISELSEKICSELTGYSILDPLLKKNNIEEININSWKDINVLYDDGTNIYIKEHFLSPNHLLNVIKRMLLSSGIVLDTSTPAVTGHLDENKRITVVAPPIIDKSLGCIASIRIINPKNLVEEDFINLGTANKEILTFLQYAYKNNISICVGGATGSGKTTLMSYLLSGIDNKKRLITIEENTREYNLIKRDKDGYMTNNVIHFVTRFSKDEEQNITIAKLLKNALTLDPDYLCVNEMKSEEAEMAVESATNYLGIWT